ncbi:MAG TPA: hypothetical protein DEA08_00965 [Planctomycetes bacterium]|nr:hypothetical protein [Planctomycetota bacterium]
MSREAEERLLRRFLESSTGFEIPDDRWRFLAPRFLDRLEGRGFADAEAYVDYLRGDPRGRAEVEELFTLLTVRKTSFFRNQASFDALAQEVIPRLAKGRSSLSVWSAGCSTGEEPYSIAIVLESLLAATDTRYFVLATDIVKEALERARRGTYPQEALVGIPPEYRAFVEQGGGQLRMNPTLRTRIDFEEHNLVHDAIPRPAEGSWDIIFCRNVFIYFSQDQISAVLRRFHRALSPGGALFLGHAEVFPGLESHFEVVFWGDSYYYRKREDPRVAPLRAARPPISSSASEVTRALPRPAPKPVPPLPDPATRSLRRPMTTTRRRRRLSESGRWGRLSASSSGDTPTRAFRREETASRPFDLVVQAESQTKSGDLEGAARTLRAAIHRAPRWARARVALAQLHRRRGRLDEAIAELERATEVEPLRTEAHVVLGEVRASRGNLADAETSLRRALYLDPRRLDARYLLAGVLRDRGAPERACRELRNVLRSLRSDEVERCTLPEGYDVSTLERRCEADVGDMGGSLADSGIWQAPPD